MKVIIDIPEDDYKLACNYPDALIECYAHYIKAGVPLPTPHGDLIDIDSKITVAIKDGLKVTTVRKLLNYTAVRLPKTIIEAEGTE